MNPTAETLDLIKQAQGNPMSDDLQKSLNQASGLVWYDLTAPAKILVPVVTPIRNEVPRVGADGGTATHWKGVTGINTTLVSGGVSEGNRGGVIAESITDYVAAYAGLGLENYVTYEATYSTGQFQDARALGASNLLKAFMIMEERVIFGGNTSMLLGTTPTPTVSTATTGGTIAAGTVSVICVALTHEGARRASNANGVVQTVTRTNADGSTDTHGGGSAIKSANATVTTSGTTSTVTATVAVVQGAVAYAWFLGPAGSERYYGISYTNSIVMTSTPGASQLASALDGADHSTNALVFDGLLTYAMKPGNGGYFYAPAVAAPLTTDGAGGIKEITAAFKWFWDNYKLGPDTIWVSSQEAQNITIKVIANGGAPLVRMMQPGDGLSSSIQAGGFVTSVLNPFTNQQVALRVHPDAVAGTMLFTTKSIPYPLSNVGNVWQIKARKDYYQIDWPPRTRKYEFGVYADELLQHFAPFTLGVITNLLNG